MAASALIKFTQGLHVGGDGEALTGATGVAVNLTNVDNTDVRSWQFDLVYVDPRSSLVATIEYAYGDSSTPAAAFTPDSPGSYRWVLKVWDAAGRIGDPKSVDIRVFSVYEENGLIVPPSQVWPLPLPDPRTGSSGARPNELNFGGNVAGWAGTGSDGLLDDLIRRLPNFGVGTNEQRDALVPKESYLWYSTTTHTWAFFDGNAWKELVTI